MILNFVFPSSSQRAGGATMVFEFANAMAQRDHEVHLTHVPGMLERVRHVLDIPFQFDNRIRHHPADSLDDPAIPSADIVFHGDRPGRLGEPVTFVQGFRLVGPIWDRSAFRAPNPKICIAGWLVDVGLAYGAPPEQLVHVPLGLDHDRFSPRHRWSERRYDVAMLYHPFYEKGWDTGYEALCSLARRRRSLRAVVFSLAGPPPEPLPGGVELMLGLDQVALAEVVYNQTRVMVQPSHHEGFGLTAVEAMACGATLVTTDCGGSRDYALPDETAVVVPAGDPAALAAAADRLLDDVGRARRLADAGAAFVRRFDWSRSASELERFLERYLEDPAAYQHPPGDDRSEDYSL